MSHTEGAWQPLPQVSLLLEPPTLSSSAAAHQAPPRRSTVAAPPQHEPWLLAAGAYAREAGGWAAATKSIRARALFQYKPYSQQEPLDASEAEVAAVVEAVFGRQDGGPSAFQVRSIQSSAVPCCDGLCYNRSRAMLQACGTEPPGRPCCSDAALTTQSNPTHCPLLHPTSLLQGEAESLWDSLAGGAAYGLASGAATTGEVAAVVLVKLVMDMYVRAGPQAAFPLTLLLLQVRVCLCCACGSWVGGQSGVAGLPSPSPCCCSLCLACEASVAEACRAAPALPWGRESPLPWSWESCQVGALLPYALAHTAPTPPHFPTATTQVPQKPLMGGEPAAQARVFDLLYNLSVHGELLYDAAASAVPEDAAALADAGGCWRLRKAWGVRRGARMRAEGSRSSSWGCAVPHLPLALHALAGNAPRPV